MGCSYCKKDFEDGDIVGVNLTLVNFLGNKSDRKLVLSDRRQLYHNLPILYLDQESEGIKLPKSCFSSATNKEGIPANVSWVYYKDKIFQLKEILKIHNQGKFDLHLTLKDEGLKLEGNLEGALKSFK